MNIVITSRQNSYIKYVRGLRSKSARDREKLFLMEGPKSISEALASGVFPVKLIVSERGKSLPVMKIISADPMEIVRVSDAVMDYISETDTSPGIIGLFPIPDVSLENLDDSANSFLVVLDGIQDPGNVGTIIRTADAFGAGAVILTKGCADLYNAKVLRSTMGSVFHLPVVREVNLQELTAFLGQKKIFTAVTSLDVSSVPISEAGLGRRPLAVVLGSEARGVSAELIGAADAAVNIATPGQAESLNVAVAAGILLYEALRDNFS